MRLLLVLAHPRADSLCAHLAGRAARQLGAAGHAVDVLDLAAAGFDPCLSAAERGRYDALPAGRLPPTAAQLQLQAAEGLVLVFPTWWFAPPALLKGWFDRVWAPGIAYEHDARRGPIQPRLHRLRRVLAVTTLGSPAWVDWLVMRRPVRRLLGTALLGACAPQAAFELLSLHRAERVEPARLRRFERALQRRLARFG
jgi:putative NADPH-quinone reductase